MKCALEGCKQKISIAKQLSNKCRCSGIFCDKHKSENKHNCKYYNKEVTCIEKSNEKKIFLENNKCVAQKLIKI